LGFPKQNLHWYRIEIECKFQLCLAISSDQQTT
jgi:hypothetical protein